MRQRNRRGEGELLRAEIIDAAIRLLERLGDDEPFSLRAVAKEAKISAPSVYLHFSDKGVLLLAVVEALFAEQIALRDAAEAKAAEAGGGPWEKLLARTIAHVRFGLERTGHYKVIYEGRAIPRLDDPKVASFGIPNQRRTVELIRELRPNGPPGEAERLTLLLGASIHGIISFRINKPGSNLPDLEELAEQMQRLLIRPTSASED